ncbi:alpha/beta hydrolase [Halalkalibacter alkalisediminis]|uniref:Alpha/beta hydrolase n=1 Tax=Halalkalibacter alkalisediminis TaxID=935616 RepID=A0ABV6NAI9_9BACI|nr:alpha/beta hydrolase [Halalkalibacter alkalisediminis]
MVHARFIRIEEQWNVIYLPERPSGFAVFLLGDNAMVVEEDTSDWEQHPERHVFLQNLLSRGYTVVASSLYNRHWGSIKAYQLLKQLYHLVLKQEILNKKIHLFAEGTGALLAIQWINEYSDRTRSCYFVNPCFSLNEFYQQEQENKLYFKRFLKELEQSYHKSKKEIDSKWIDSITPEIVTKQIPPLSIHCHMLEKRYPLSKHSRPFQQKLATQEVFVNLRIHGNDKSFYKAAQSVFPFYKKYEKYL